MKNALRKTMSLVIAGLLTLTGVPAVTAQAATGTDSYQPTRGIDSLGVTFYDCKAGNNVTSRGDNVIKLHLKEHNDTASTGKKVGAFSVFTDDPNWMAIVAVDGGRDANIPFAVGEDNYPGQYYTSGKSITVANHSAEEDCNGNQTYEGGAYVFLVANDYRGTGTNEETDRIVGVTIVSRKNPNTITYEDCTNILIDIDAADPVVEVVEPEPEPIVEEPEPEPVAEEPVVTPEPTPEPTPVVDNSGDNSNNSNTNNGNGNININGNGNTVTIIVNPGDGSKPKEEGATVTKPEETTEPEATETPEEVEDPEPADPTEETDDFDKPAEDDSTVFDIGDEIETETATYTVTETEKGKFEVEYSDFDDDTAKTVTIPKTMTIDGIVFKVTSIADEAFKGNTKLTQINIGSNVKEIGNKAFWGCKKLRTLKIATASLKMNNVGSQAFKNVYAKVTIRVSKAKISSYKKIFIKRGLSKKAKFKAI